MTRPVSVAIRPVSAKIEVYVPQDEECNALLLSGSDVSEYDAFSDSEEVAPEDEKSGDELPGLMVKGYSCHFYPFTTTSPFPRTNMRTQLRLELRDFRRDFLDLHPKIADAKRKMLPLFNEFRDSMACKIQQPAALMDLFCSIIKAMAQYFTTANETIELYKVAAENAAALGEHAQTEILEQHRAYMKINLKDAIRSVNRTVRILTSMLPDRKSDYVISQDTLVERIIREINRSYEVKEEPLNQPKQPTKSPVVHHSVHIPAEENLLTAQQMTIAPAVRPDKKTKRHQHQPKHTKTKVSPASKEIMNKERKSITNQPSKSSLKDGKSSSECKKRSKVLFTTTEKKKLPRIFTKFKSPKGTVYREQIRGANASPYSAKVGELVNFPTLQSYLNSC